GQLLCDSGAGPVEVVPPPLVGGCGHDGHHQVGSVHAVDVRHSCPATTPHQRHPIGSHHASAVMNLLERRITLGLDDTMDAGHADVLTVARPAPGSNAGYRLGQVYCADLDAEDVDSSQERA